MKIREVNAPESKIPKTFKDVEIGEVFRIGGVVAIKMEGFYNCVDMKFANAVDLRTHEDFFVKDDTEVEVYVGEVQFDESDWCGYGDTVRVKMVLPDDVKTMKFFKDHPTRMGDLCGRADEQ